MRDGSRTWSPSRRTWSVPRSPRMGEATGGRTETVSGPGCGALRPAGRRGARRSWCCTAARARITSTCCPVSTRSPGPRAHLLRPARRRALAGRRATCRSAGPSRWPTSRRSAGIGALERLTLAGYSWGGLLALLYALAHPGRVGRLALVSPAPTWRAARERFEAAFARRNLDPAFQEERRAAPRERAPRAGSRGLPAAHLRAVGRRRTSSIPSGPAISRRSA